MLVNYPMTGLLMKVWINRQLPTSPRQVLGMEILSDACLI
ncbi:uncharacterized protein METZ01_LOCUS418309 [marine metagenome]|uniref:Uncharacterized protein n=1 Tax=marine metagenome TaxID=408172 RepID=A0A382X4C7_9ZZZZ